MPAKKGSKPPRRPKKPKVTTITFSDVDTSGSSPRSDPAPPSPHPALQPKMKTKTSAGVKVLKRTPKGPAKDHHEKAFPTFLSTSPHKSLAPRINISSDASSTTLIGSSQSSKKRERPSSPMGPRSDTDIEGDDIGLFDLDAAVVGVLDGSDKSSADHLTSFHHEAEEHMPTFRPAELPAGVEKGYSLLVKRRYNFWPGFLVDFFPAQSAQEQKTKGDRYKVHVHGEGVMEKRRRDIIFLADEDIAECSLGSIHVSAGTLISDAATRETTPPSAGPSIPPSPSAFAALSRREQLMMIRPRLTDIISEQAAPSQWRNEAFYEGAKGSDRSTSTVMYGDLREEEVSAVILPELERWALRAERWQDHDDRDKRGAECPRPVGSDKYESLSAPRRRRYIADILLPEAIIHLSILSEGLTDPGSQKAYEAARETLEELSSGSIEMDWQIRYRELREARARMRKRRKLPKEGMTEEDRKQARLKAGEMESFFSGRVRPRLFNEDG